MKIKKFKLEDLIPAEYNPRTITDEALKGLQRSIEKFGYLQPIIVNIHGGTSVIVGGHQRAKAMLAEGIKDAKCVVVDFDKTTEKAANIALNSETISGDWDTEGLEEILEELKVDLPEFEDINLDDLAESLDIDLSSPEADDRSAKKKNSANELPDAEFKIEVLCVSEQEQEKTFNDLTEQGYECRILTL